MNRKKIQGKNLERRFRYVSVWIVYVTAKKNKSSMWGEMQSIEGLNCISYQQSNQEYGLFVALTSLSLG